MTYSTLEYQVQGGIATITVNRPDTLNALTATVIAELDQAAAAAESDPEVRGLIITGAGAKAFIAGADIGELGRQGPLDAKARSLRGQAVFRRFEASRKPVIAAINGFCLGGGCELAMACHLRIASEQAKFGQPEVKLGIGPGYGGTVRLPRLVGRGRALELLLTGELIDAREAWRIGLVNRVVPAERLLRETETLLRSILAQGPLAVAAVLEAVDAGSEVSTPEALRLEANLFGLLSSTQDMREGMAAFLAKRPPNFEGR
ncbi:MAG TPA: enoyl-CoA hydratase-related protein [Gemmatimonadales bacterium]|jgi:enoyl-CoA hydratase